MDDFTGLVEVSKEHLLYLINKKRDTAEKLYNEEVEALLKRYPVRSVGPFWKRTTVLNKTYKDVFTSKEFIKDHGIYGSWDYHQIRFLNNRITDCDELKRLVNSETGKVHLTIERYTSLKSWDE